MQSIPSYGVNFPSTGEFSNIIEGVAYDKYWSIISAPALDSFIAPGPAYIPLNPAFPTGVAGYPGVQISDQQDINTASSRPGFYSYSVNVTIAYAGVFQAAVNFQVDDCVYEVILNGVTLFTDAKCLTCCNTNTNCATGTGRAFYSFNRAKPFAILGLQGGDVINTLTVVTGNSGGAVSNRHGLLVQVACVSP